MAKSSNQELVNFKDYKHFIRFELDETFDFFKDSSQSPNGVFPRAFDGVWSVALKQRIIETKSAFLLSCPHNIPPHKDYVFSFPGLDLEFDRKMDGMVEILPTRSTYCGLTIYRTEGLDKDQYNSLLEGNIMEGLSERVVAQIDPREIIQGFATKYPEQLERMINRK